MKRLFPLHVLRVVLLGAALTLCAQEKNSLADRLRAMIDEQGLAVTQQRFEALRSQQEQNGGFGGYGLDEREMNALGYHYLQEGKIPEAVAVLTWNVELFPQSGNTHDSLGEALVHQGNAQAALEHYRKACDLDPKNRNAEAMVKELTEPDGFPRLRERLQLANEIDRAGDAAAAATLRPRLDRFLQQYPQANGGVGLVDAYLRLVETIDLHLAGDAWRSFATSPNPEIAALAQAKLPLAEAMATPLELAFTAVDGRAVDLDRLRGKVVLIDFWATWCGPCKAELPNVKAVYDKYHAQGFEVVGIALDREKDRQKLADYCREHGLDWPQYFDGQYWKTAPAAKYAIRSIPATFLLDRTGRLVALGVRGERLEPLVRQQLGLAL